MKIGLIDCDGFKFPNLALMKLSAYHKTQGDDVRWVGIGAFDKTYISKVFTYKKTDIGFLASLGEVIQGGTGFNNNILPENIEHIMPDYSLYKTDKAYGFLTRGCPNNCPWCIVPEKEGDIKANADITEFWNGQKEAVLLDNNVLASKYGIKQIEKIRHLGIKIDFNQGLDCRLIDKSIAKLLAETKWINFLRLACDTKKQIPYIKKALEKFNRYGFKNYRVFVYVLVKDIPDALERVEFLKELGCNPFAQPYRDFKTNKEPAKELKHFARWVNHKAIFKSVSWKEYNWNKEHPSTKI